MATHRDSNAGGDAVPPVGDLDECVARQHACDRLAQAREGHVDCVPVTERVVLPTAPDIPVQHFESDPIGACAGKLLEQLDALGRERELGIRGTDAPLVEGHRHVEGAGRLLVGVDQPGALALLDEESRRPIEPQARDAARQRLARPRRNCFCRKAGAGAGAQEGSIPQLGVRVLQRSSQLVAAAAEVSRTFGEECAHEVRRNEQRQVGIPLRNRHAAPERRARL